MTSLNGLHGGLTLSAGSNVTITPSGSTLTIASTGGGSGGLSLPFTGSSSTAATTFAVSNTGGGQAIEADSNATGFNVSANPFAIKGVSTGDTGTGVYGSTHGTSGEGGYTGVWGDSHDATAVQGTSVNDRGVLGITSSAASAGVEGLNRSSGGAGVLGIIGSGSGKSSTAGVWGDSDASGAGVSGTGNSAIGVYGKSTANWGIYGETGNATYAGTAGLNTGGGPGVYAESSSGSGIYAKSGSGIAGYFYSNSNGPALYVDNNNSSYVVAQFEGPIDVNGNVVTSGAGAVRLDDPRDPSNRSITHTFVGSSEMKNIYDGVAVLGASGTVTVVLPDWFDVLNRDFRYQLTALGTPQAGLFVSREIIGNSFTIAGGVPGARVSWQVTGVRKDRWAQDHPVAVIENKHVGGVSHLAINEAARRGEVTMIHRGHSPPCEGEAAGSRPIRENSEDHDLVADFHELVKRSDVVVAHPDAAVGDRLADLARLVGSVDPESAAEVDPIGTEDPLESALPSAVGRNHDRIPRENQLAGRKLSGRRTGDAHNRASAHLQMRSRRRAPVRGEQKPGPRTDRDGLPRLDTPDPETSLLRFLDEIPIGRDPARVFFLGLNEKVTLRRRENVFLAAGCQRRAFSGRAGSLKDDFPSGRHEQPVRGGVDEDEQAAAQVRVRGLVRERVGRARELLGIRLEELDDPSRPGRGRLREHRAREREPDQERSQPCGDLVFHGVWPPADSVAFAMPQVAGRSARSRLVSLQPAEGPSARFRRGSDTR